MKTVGIIAGIGPESTIDYYRSIITRYRELQPDGSYPSIIINSINLKRLLPLIETNQLAEVTKYLSAEIQRLAAAGSDFGVLAAATPHIVFDDIQNQSTIPLLSIVEATCQAADTPGLKRLGLFGTRFTMQGRFFPEVFSRAGKTVVVPEHDEQEYIHDKYFNELVSGVVLQETRDGLLEIVGRMRDRAGIDGLILGGTELALILRDKSVAGIPLLNTTQIHVKAIVAELLS
ncbi:MAG TPA: amino acid racemase [Pyrinomonadaceae bacterium]|nr:amino acid racemase [Pyrinomonadaceae bacterium]